MALESETRSIVVYDGVAEWLESKQQHEMSDKSQGCKIPRVPQLLRQMGNNQCCYDPRVVSLGPYHHGKQELFDVEKLKPGIALLYVGSTRREAQELYDSVAEVSREARKCYVEGSTDMFDDEAFVRMMFLDACFILQFLWCSVHKLPNPKLRGLLAAFVKRDLFLLENQIPLLVLKALLHAGHQNEDDWNTLINAFLELIRPHTASKSPTNKMSKDVVSGDPVHLLELLWNELVGEVKFDHKHRNVRNWSSYRSAKELKSVGIHFRPSKSHHFTDVRFFSTLGAGYLHLPPIIIDDSTKSTLLNLVAYEASPLNASKEFQIASYICLMDELIDQAEDVKELRSKGILLNFLVSDQQVAELFNEIASELVPSPWDYMKVKHRIETYYRNRMTIWMAEWVHTHFTSPWALLAFLGALLALILTVVSTYFQVRDSLKPSEEKCKTC